MNILIVGIILLFVIYIFNFPKIDNAIDDFKIYWFHKRKHKTIQLDMRSELSQCEDSWDVFCWLQNKMQDEIFSVDFLREVVNMLDDYGRAELESRMINCIKYGHYLTLFFATNCNTYIKDEMVKYSKSQLKQLNAIDFFKIYEVKEK